MEIKEIQTHRIPASNDLDPIDVFIVWYGEQAFQITIRCWDQAWTAYRGSCGFPKLEDYFVDVWFERGYHEHLVNLFIPSSRKVKSREKEWLSKIVQNMCIYFKESKVNQ